MAPAIESSQGDSTRQCTRYRVSVLWWAHSKFSGLLLVRGNMVTPSLPGSYGGSEK